MEFKDKLKQTRIERGMTQEDVAAVCSVSISAIKKYEIGLIEPSVESLLKLSVGFNINPVEFMVCIPEFNKLLDVLKINGILNE